MTEAQYKAMCRRQRDEIAALWARWSDVLTPDEMRDLSWATVERH